MTDRGKWTIGQRFPLTEALLWGLSPSFLVMICLVLELGHCMMLCSLVLELVLPQSRF